MPAPAPALAAGRPTEALGPAKRGGAASSEPGAEGPRSVEVLVTHGTQKGEVTVSVPAGASMLQVKELLARRVGRRPDRNRDFATHKFNTKKKHAPRGTCVV